MFATTVFPIPSLAPGASADMMFRVTIPNDIAVGATYNGFVGVVSGLITDQLGMKFTVGTNSTGSLEVVVVDEVRAGKYGI